MLLGLCRQQLQEYAKAQTSFLAAAALKPDDPKPRYAIARTRFLMGSFEDALIAAQQALQLGEPPGRVHHLRARIEEERGRFVEALAEYRRAITADHSMVEALSGEASVLYKLGRYTEARSSAQAALQLDPNSTEAANVIDRVGRAGSWAEPGPAQPVRFTRMAAIEFRLQHSPTPEKYLPSTMAGGLAVFDFDDDGLVDVFFANGAELPSMRKSGPRFWNRLFRNRGNFQFQDVTEREGLQGQGFSIGAAAGDFDNDGRADLFVAGLGRNLLYRGTTKGFREVTRSAGIRDETWSVAAAWIDYDRDGWLDLFVVNYLDWRPEPERYCGDRNAGLRVYCNPRDYSGLPNRLYRNRGNGTFEDVTKRSGIGQHVGKGMSAAVLDADSDGWPDLFVTNDTQANYLFRNRGNGFFEERALEFGVAFNEQGKAVSSMGVDARDYDNDGRPDLIVTALTGENFPLFRNTGARNFQDVTFPSRLGQAAIRRSGWGAVFADLNNDGWKDLVTANSHVTDNVGQFRSEVYEEPSTAFLNRNGLFVATQEIGPAAAHRGLAITDFDNDGRLDMIVTVLGERPELWRNETRLANWLRLKLAGFSIGARIRIGDQWQERTSASGYASSNLDAVHFGLGQQAIVPEIEIFWPGGYRQVLKSQNARETLVVREPTRQ
jgi:tetratricopeptide (TPR) repeat protein